jgi:hypothetical protein
MHWVVLIQPGACLPWRQNIWRSGNSERLEKPHLNPEDAVGNSFSCSLVPHFDYMHAPAAMMLSKRMGVIVG